MNTEPNFCAFCSHRLYQHNDRGCEHVDVSYVKVGNATDSVTREVRTPCDCRHRPPLPEREPRVRDDKD
jgi:hypothetical protein